MTIIEKIKASIVAVLGEDFPVYYNDDPGFNLETGEMEFPCIIIRLLQTGDVVEEGMQFKEKVAAAIFAVDLTEFDADAEENEEIIDTCKQTLLGWYGQLSQDAYISATKKSTSRVYQQYDDIVTGWGMLLDVTELEGFTDC